MKHGPNRLAAYQEIHETVMAQQRHDGFVVSDDVHFTSAASVVMTGTIYCRGGIRISVFKRMRILEGEGPNATVQTVYYSYQIWLENSGNLFRYDAPHTTHNKFHHRHRYQLFEEGCTGEAERLENEDEWPHLSEVIEEARTWYYRHYDELEG